MIKSRHYQSATGISINRCRPYQITTPLKRCLGFYKRSILTLAVTMSPHLAICGPADALNSFPPIQSDDWLKPVPTAIIDDDDRRTEAEYARENGLSILEVKQHFGATGLLKCPTIFGTAQVTLKNNIITTSAHAFYNENTCRQISHPAKCFVEFSFFGKNRIYNIEKLLSIGYNCPVRPKFYDDWAVLKLKDAVEDVIPYTLPSDRTYPVTYGDKIIAVTVGATDFFKAKEPDRAIGNCLAKHDGVREDRSMGWFTTNCDAAPGASGGSILRRSNDGGYELLGIFKGTNEEEASARKAVTRRKPNSGPYVEGKWVSSGIAVTSDFYDAIIEAGR